MDKMRLIDDVINTMMPVLDEEQVRLLESTLLIKLHGVTITEEQTDLVVSDRSWEWYLMKFCADKRIENCAESTLAGYCRFLRKMYSTIRKPIEKVTSEDLRYYIAIYQYRHGKEKPLSLSYMNDMRHCFSSFFGWAYSMEYIGRDPSKGIRKIRVPEKILEPYTEHDRIALMEAAKTDRDLAIMQCLYSTGMRISELLSLNRQDIQYNGRRAEAVLHNTKNKAERRVYFSEKAVFYLRRYLANRSDSNEALFVSEKAPHRRLNKGGAEAMMTKLGKNTGIHAYCHRWRRSFITDACKRGMPIEVAARLAGHKKLNTTARYRVVGDDEAREASARFAVA